MASDSSHEQCRRRFLQTSGWGLASGLAIVAGPAQSEAQSSSTSVNPGQRSGSGLTPTDTAVVFIDPQNDVLSEKGKAWAAVGQSVTENKTVENMERIFQTAKQRGFEVFISPHYFYPTDSGWKFNGPLESSEASRDATAGPRHPEWGYGHTAALINFRFLAHAVLATDEVLAAMAPGVSTSR